MERHQLTLRVLSERIAIALLDANDDFPAWAIRASFASITKTSDELSIVCVESEVPSNIAKVERGWRALRVEGVLEFPLTGILASIAEPLASARISIFALSTFYSDYVLVKKDVLTNAIEVLQNAGHTVTAA